MCTDLELYTTLSITSQCVNFCRAKLLGQKPCKLAERLKEILSQPPWIHRIRAGIKDPLEDLRYRCFWALWVLGLKGRGEAFATLIHDASEDVRGGVCEVLYSAPDASTADKLIEVALGDSSPFVRARATQALGRVEPRKAIPVLLDILERDHADDPATGTDAPSSFAASALDELLQSDYTAIHLDGGVCQILPHAPDLEALTENARAYLKGLLNE